ncbi:MAG TPA: tetratricopeptide repeat protein [Gemmatimonadaceae bacterium]|nr:tetratricopeptide repeat protein [Gemmatimonadaceae bacterium]
MRRSLRIVRLVMLVACALVAGAMTLRAQSLPPRPELDRGADPNDWSAYFDFGVKKLKTRPTEAEAAFIWASQLAPDRAEPLFARWVAFHRRDYKRWVDYLRDDAKTLDDRAVQQADSVRALAFVRNPFVYEGLEIILYDQLPGYWGTDEFTKGWLAYAALDFPHAADFFARAIAHQPDRMWGVHMLRATAFVQMHRLDSAMTEVEAMRAAVEQYNAARTRAYESKEMLDYAIGLLCAARGRTADAEDAMRNALTENLAFAPGHFALGDFELKQGHVDSALTEYAQAVQLDSTDAVLLAHQGTALLHAGRAAESVAALRRATQLAPYYAAPWFTLGQALEATGDRAQAARAYATFVARAPRSDVLLGPARAKVAQAGSQ